MNWFSAAAQQDKKTFFAIIGIILILITAVYIVVAQPFTAHNIACETAVSDYFKCVEIVDTDNDRYQGLSGTADLRNSEAMLFVFDEVGQYGFVMRDMNYDLDMVWINDDGVVVKVQKDASHLEPTKVYQNTVPARFVLEMKSGMAERKGIEVGTVINLDLEES